MLRSLLGNGTVQSTFSDASKQDIQTEILKALKAAGLEFPVIVEQGPILRVSAGADLGAFKRLYSFARILNNNTKVINGTLDYMAYERARGIFFKKDYGSEARLSETAKMTLVTGDNPNFSLEVDLSGANLPEFISNLKALAPKLQSLNIRGDKTALEGACEMRLIP